MSNYTEDFPYSPIKFTRGDTYRGEFQRLDRGGHPILVQATKIYFTVKKTTKDRNALIQKTIDDMTFDGNGTYRFVIDPEETEKLAYGEYVYDVEVITDGGKETIAQSPFIVGDEVTFPENEV